MKKMSVLIVLFYTTFTSSVSAQTETVVGLSFGSGYFSPIEVPDNFSPENRFVYHAGMFVLQPLSEKYFIQSGLLYNFERSEVVINQFDPTVKLPLNSLELPVNIGRNFGSHWCAKIGIAGIWMAAKNIKHEKTVFNWQVGMGYSIKWTTFSLDYQQALNSPEFMVKDENSGYFLKYKRRAVKLEIDIPVSTFFKRR